MAQAFLALRGEVQRAFPALADQPHRAIIVGESVTILGYGVYKVKCNDPWVESGGTGYAVRYFRLRSSVVGSSGQKDRRREALPTEATAWRVMNAWNNNEEAQGAKKREQCDSSA